MDSCMLRFLKKWKNIKPGMVRGVDKNIAEVLVENEIAEYVKKKTAAVVIDHEEEE